MLCLGGDVRTTDLCQLRRARPASPSAVKASASEALDRGSLHRQEVRVADIEASKIERRKEKAKAQIILTFSLRVSEMVEQRTVARLKVDIMAV